MASGGKGTSFVKPRKGFMALLRSAVCEWLMIFMLLLDALLSYVLTKFASYCQLQMPCLLCSRLDHMLSRERPEFYENLFCSNHKLEISSLVLCHIHGKLADGDTMCDDCLLSVTAKTKRNAKSHRLLVGKFGLVVGGSGFKSPSLSRDLFAGSKGERSSTRHCNCCGKLWKSEHNTSRSIQLKSSGRAVLRPYIPLPCPPRKSRLNHRDNMKIMGDNFDESEEKNSSLKPLYQVGYNELTFTSDTESDFPFSDDDDVSSVFHENIETSDNDPTAQITSALSSTCVPSDLDLENQESFNSDLAEVISTDEVSPSPILMNVPSRESESEDIKIVASSQDSLPAPLSELNMTLNGTHAHAGASSEKSADVAKANNIGMVFEKNEEVLEKIGTEEKESMETHRVVCDSAAINPKEENSSNMNNSYVKEVDDVKEELEQSPSNKSSPNGSNTSSNVHSPEMDAEASKSNGFQELKKSSSVESGLDSLDGSNIVEIEGESNVDRLSRQIEYYKKCMESLQKELEEERNASAISTNEAMSMITRLQEEKAALQMEALQYLRMMEEQAEYDNDELDKVNDLLTEKEKELQDLEAELDYYRSNTGDDEPIVDNMHKESWDLKGESVATQNTGVHDIKDTLSSSKNAEEPKVGDEAETGGAALLEFEEEKEYISHCLKNLEEKVHRISLRLPNKYQQGASNGEWHQLATQKSINRLNGNHIGTDSSADADGDDWSLSEENNHSTYFEPPICTPRRELELVALENEISDLNDRLEALEFDRDLLAHITNSLQNGNDGKQFIQDIASRLHELRKITSR